MTPYTLDNIAIGLALGAIVMRALDRPWFASVMGSCSLCCSVVAQALSRRTRPTKWS
jgi:uncharacterized membrane protein